MIVASRRGDAYARTGPRAVAMVVAVFGGIGTAVRAVPR